MLASQLLFLSSLLPLLQAQETVLGVYIFHRHGDRTSKAFAPTSLTDLGYSQVYASGDFYRSRYVDASATSPIYGISSNLVKLSQLNVQAPVDNVLQNSAAGFLQGLYPPVGTALGSQGLANGTNVTSPLNGFQLIPVNAVATASSSANSENSAWLQGMSGCNNAIVSSNNYFSSAAYQQTLNSTAAFYQNIFPVISSVWPSSYDSYKNAYSIYDYIHVSQIHNKSSTIPSDDLLTPETVFQLQTLADQHEFGLAYNATEPIRAVAGSTLAAQILQQLNSTITGKSKQPVGVQFGAYASFLSFFGLASLPAVSTNFTGVVDYASSMTFELITNATVSNTSYPDVSDISVRFLFSNGTAAENPLTAYPLFGQQGTEMPWETFAQKMGDISIGDLNSWCQACGNTTGVCADSSSSSSSSSSSGTTTVSSSSLGSGSGISNAVAGVIGAMVTLAVILGLEALVMLIGGLRIARKRSGRAGPESQVGNLKASA